MTESQWRNVDDAFIAKMEALESAEIVRLLEAGDDDAWRYVYARSVIPLLRRSSFGSMVRDRRRSDLDVCGAVFDYLIAQQKLKQYRGDNGCPVVMWIRFWVARDILGYCRKNDNPVSDEGLEDVLRDDDDKISRLAMREELNKGYRKLWHEDRLKARVLYLKLIEERSSREIVQLLGVSSESNVDQLFARARKRMRELIEQGRDVKERTAVKDPAKQSEIKKKNVTHVMQEREAAYEMS